MALAGGPDEGVDLDAILALAPCYVGGYITPGSCNQPKRVYQGLSLVPCDCDNYYFWKTPQCAWYDPPA
jgi:hypothetical protein